MPATWAGYGVDADGDGVADPYDPEDAIYAAANYLQRLRACRLTGTARSSPTTTPTGTCRGARQRRLLRRCIGAAGGALRADAEAARSWSCEPSAAWREKVPTDYLNAFEEAAARYGLGRRGVWALAAISRLESNFGGGMANASSKRARLASIRPSGSPTPSTATATVASITRALPIRPRPWPG